MSLRCGIDQDSAILIYNLAAQSLGHSIINKGINRKGKRGFIPNIWEHRGDQDTKYRADQVFEASIHGDMHELSLLQNAL